MRIVCMAVLVALCSMFVVAQSKHEARITKEQAKKIALESLKGGTVKDGELEKEEGKLVWSFDIKVGKEIKEVWVDATTGVIVKTEMESMSKEKSEASVKVIQKKAEEKKE